MTAANKSRVLSALQLISSSPKANRRFQSQSGTFSLQKPVKMRVKWVRYKKKGWCALNNLNLENISTIGIYVIWKPQSYVVRIGQGDIASELHSLRNNPKITQFGRDLLVTWASVSEDHLDGVERFLYEQFSPMNADRVPNARMVQVNLPGKKLV